VQIDFLAGIRFFFDRLALLLGSLGSHFSITSLAVAFLVAASFFVWQRVKRGRRVYWRTIWRALFPSHIMRHRSNQIDIFYLFLNVFLAGILFGWAVLAYQFITNGIIATLIAVFGPVTPSTLPAVASRGIVTVMMFLAYELGYWFNHWLSHKVPVLWEFHKVHHTAEVLTPITNFRVHPVYGWIFANILAIAAATASGFGNYLFGATTYQYAITDTNLILVVFIHAYVHLQHSHMWISFQGAFGRIFISPAHHQVHHSADPKHFNTNFGSCLALWDWMFGTLYVPQKEREPLTFGVPDHAKDEHTVRGELIEPVIKAAGHLKPLLPKRAPDVAPVADRERV
jgi:sterol desaturase/sphingolipid hydroxylase (fatty acid hydroxylase superfamily)